MKPFAQIAGLCKRKRKNEKSLQKRKFLLHFCELFDTITKLILSFCSRSCGLVAQLDRVFDYESKGRGFESRRAHQENPCKTSTCGGFHFALIFYYLLF